MNGGKEAMSFLHDSNSRYDVKMLKLWNKFGYEGIGLFWCIVEILREQPDFKYLVNDIHLIAIELRIDKVLINDLIRYCLQDEVKLFKEENGQFFSESLLRRMEKFKNAHLRMSMGGKLGMENRYSKDNSKVVISSLKGTYKVVDKVKEKKRNKSSLNSSPETKIELLRKDKERMKESLKEIWFKNIKYYMEKYPGRDYNLERDKMEAWIDEKPKDAKKKSDWNLFIHGWLGRTRPQYGFKNQHITLPIDRCAPGETQEQFDARRAKDYDEDETRQNARQK